MSKIILKISLIVLTGAFSFNASADLNECRIEEKNINIDYAKSFTDEVYFSPLSKYAGKDFEYCLNMVGMNYFFDEVHRSQHVKREYSGRLFFRSNNESLICSYTRHKGISADQTNSILPKPDDSVPIEGDKIYELLNHSEYKNAFNYICRDYSEGRTGKLKRSRTGANGKHIVHQ